MDFNLLLFIWLFLKYKIYNLIFHFTDTKLFTKNIYETEIKSNGIKYKLLYQVKNHPKPFINKITDEHDQDITQKILKYAGINMDFSGIKIYPKYFGFNQVKVYEDDEIKIFERDDEIKLFPY